MNSPKPHGSRLDRSLGRTVSALMIANLAGIAVVTSIVAYHTLTTERRDWTGDAIEDELHHFSRPRILLIGKGNGEYVQASEQKLSDGTTYFETPEGIAYRFDGKFYRPSE